MADLSAWSKIPADNDLPAPDGPPEGWSPADVNDVLRTQMADIRGRWGREYPDFFDWGHTPVRLSSNSFLASVSHAVSPYSPGRRLRLLENTGAATHGKVLGHTASGANTIVTVSASTPLSTIFSAIQLGIFTDTGYVTAPEATVNKSSISETVAAHHSNAPCLLATMTAERSLPVITGLFATGLFGSVVILDSWGVAGVSASGSTAFRINFQATLSTSTYAVLVSSHGANLTEAIGASPPIIPVVLEKTTTSFKIRLYTTAGVLTNSGGAHFMVYRI